MPTRDQSVAARYTGSSAPGLTHNSGAATSTAPARHTRHARRVTPQSGLVPAGPLTGLRHVGALKPDASHLWLPRHMELPHGYIARTTWGVTWPLARGARAACLHRRQIGLRQEHDAVQLGHARHRSRRRGRRHRPARRPGRGGRGLHPARAHPCGLLSGRRRCRAPGRLQSAGAALRPSAMRSPPPAWSPPSSICGARAGDRALNIFYFTASWRLLARAARHAHRLAAPLY